MTNEDVRATLETAAPIAAEIASQDGALTAHPYLVVHEGNPEKSREWWTFVSTFLTRERAEAFIYVESAHNNYEIRAARQAFADVQALAKECLAREDDIASGERHSQRLAACIGLQDAKIRDLTAEVGTLRAEVERLTRERAGHVSEPGRCSDEAEQAMGVQGEEAGG